MALTLGLEPGSSFYVDDTRVSVHKITHSLNFKLKVHTPAMDYIYEITDKRAVEIIPQVMVSAGNKASSEMVKVVITAPKVKKILREKLYHQSKNES